MATITEKSAETLIQEHLRERKWPITDLAVITKGFKEKLDGQETEYAIVRDGRPAAFIETKRPGRDLWTALDQARGYARAYRESTRHAVTFVFASDGTTYVLRNLRANTFPEKSTVFPAPAEIAELSQPQASVLHGRLRDYQRIAVFRVLGGVQAGRRLYLQKYAAFACGNARARSPAPAKQTTTRRSRR